MCRCMLSGVTRPWSRWSTEITGPWEHAPRQVLYLRLSLPSAVLPSSVNSKDLEAVPLDASRAQDVAGGAPAHFECVIGGRSEAEVRVEGRDPPDVVDGRLGVGRHLLDGRTRKVPKLVMRRVQGGEHGDSGLLLRGDCTPHAISQRFVAVGQPRATCRIIRTPQS